MYTVSRVSAVSLHNEPPHGMFTVTHMTATLMIFARTPKDAGHLAHIFQQLEPTFAHVDHVSQLCTERTEEHGS